MKSVDVMKCKLVKEKEVSYSAINSPESAVNLFRALGLADSAEEIFAIVCLATDGSIVGIHEVSHGSLSLSLVHPREVFKRAFLNNAASIILCHNHPSGNLDPSVHDLEATAQIKAAGELLRLPVLDHIIVSSTGYISLQAEGLF